MRDNSSRHPSRSALPDVHVETSTCKYIVNVYRTFNNNPENFL
jgi:hypothetical protein